MDKYKNGELQWDKLSRFVKEAHRNRIGSPKRRVAIQGRPKEEDYFYSNPNECLQLLDEPLRLMVNWTKNLLQQLSLQQGAWNALFHIEICKIFIFVHNF